MAGMSESPGSASPRSVLARIRELRGLARAGDRADLDLTPPSLEELLRHTRRQLIECAQCVGLTGAQRLTKAALAMRVQQELERIALLAGAPEPADASRKFDLGFTSAAAGRSEDIPWGYGRDRVTAMAVEPERLYVYWEVTDEALERARAALGPGGRDAWLNLRVYDVTNRIFDGTNAHHYFDHSVSRTDRQWFFFIGRPSSTVIVEVGLKSAEGYFVRVARSGRADFPRREPVSPGRVEWLTVLSASGEVGEPATDNRRARPPSSPAAPDRPASPRLVRVWDIRRTHGGWDGEWIIRDESFGTEWEEWGEWVREPDDRVGRADHPHQLGSRPVFLPGGAAALRRGAVRGDGDGPLRGGHDPTSSTVRGGSSSEGSGREPSGESWPSGRSAARGSPPRASRCARSVERPARRAARSR